MHASNLHLVEGKVRQGEMPHNQKRFELKALVQKKILDYHLEGKTLLLAVSSGIDSMVMLDLFTKLAAEFNLNLALCYVDHQLRKESKDECVFLERESRERKFRFYTRQIDVLKEMEISKESLEMAAHRLRKEALSEVQREIAADYILTAHHQDDQVETVLMRIGFGTGRRGINGLAENNGVFFKPLLEAKKSEIESYQKKYRIPYRFDSSNADSKIVRNFWRNDVLPLIRKRYRSSFETNLLKTVENLNWRQEDYDLLEKEVKRIRKDKAFVQVDINRLKLYFSEFLKAYVERLLDEFFDISYHLNQNEFERLVDMLHHGESGKKLILNKKLQICRSFNNLELSLLTSNKKEGVDVNYDTDYRVNEGLLRLTKLPQRKKEFSSDRRIECIDAKKITGQIKLRQVSEGDYFYPIGFKHKQSLNRFFKSKKIGLAERKKQELLEDDNGIIWIIAQRLDERYKIDKTTESCIKLEVLNDSGN